MNTYGVPNYKEINPAYFACVTFPFLFGVMFGDVGHGSVLLLSGILMCMLNSCLSRIVPDLKSIFTVRYLILLMGCFAFFCGLVYNDMMAIPLTIFDSCYDT